MRIHTLLAFPFALLVVACSGVMTTREQPQVSDQKLSEAGQLPVGRVVTVERVDFQRQAQLSTVGLASAGVGPLGAAIANSVRNADWSYRYNLVMKDGVTRIVESQYLYKQGECLAFRSGLSVESVSAVRALPSECD
jgi:hypothetical protein